MTDSFTPQSLRLTPEPPIATANSEPALEFLTGPALRALIAERMQQIETHGHHPDSDLLYQEGELALAAKSYLDTYIDLELRPDLAPTSLPASWPFADLFWKEPTPDRRAHALTKALALGLAELDRLLAAMAILRAARPLIEYPSDDATPLHKLDWHG